MILTFGGSDRRSPFGNVNNLLSSKTEFKFSTHSGSTSPSKIIHCLLFISPRTLSTIFLEHYTLHIILIYKIDNIEIFLLKMLLSKFDLPQYMSKQTISPFSSVRI